MIGRLLSRLFGDGRMRDIAVITGGTVISQIAIIASAPLITRLYSPEDWGTFAVFSAILGTVTVIASLHYELAIPLPVTDHEAFNVLLLAIAVVCGFALAFVPFIIIFGDKVVSLLNAQGLVRYLWLLPVSLLAFGIPQVLSMWAVRKRSFHLISTATGCQGVGQAIPQVGLGLLAPGVLGLLAGQLTGQLLGIGVLSKGLAACPTEDRRFDVATMKQVARDYRRFPLFASWSSLINMATAQLPVLVLSYSYGARTAGFYALSFRVLQMPIRFIGQGISQVFFSAAADAHKRGDLAGVTLNAHNKLVRLLLPATVIIAVIAPELFALCFGESWREAGTYSQFIMPWLLVGFVTSTLSLLVSVLQRQSTELGFQIMYCAVLVLSFWAGHRMGAALWTMALLGGLGAAYMLVKLAWLLKITGNSLRQAARVWALELAKITPAVALLLLMKFESIPQFAVCAVGFAAGAILVYYNFAWRRTTNVATV